MRIVMALALLCGVQLGLAGDGVKLTPPQTKSGVTCRITGATLSTTLMVEGGERRHNLSLSLVVGGSTAFAVGMPHLTEVLDENEHDVRVPQGTAEQPPEHVRQQLESMFANALHRDQRNEDSTAAHTHLSRCPKTLQRVSGVLPVVVAKRLVREKVDLKEMAEAIEVAPGVTFLLSRVESREGSTTVTYEARVKRGREGVTPGLEPVFAGLVVRDPSGQIMSTFHYPQPVETRDEYIYVIKNVGISQSYLERGGHLEVCVFDGLERVEFAFGVSNMDVVTGAPEPKK